MPTIFFDIETEGLPIEELDPPAFEAPSNYKDAEKIAASKKEQLDRWLERIALDPLTARVLCIGILQLGRATVLEGDEIQMLVNFWAWVSRCQTQGGPVVGFNTHHFDLPFLIKRSIKYGVNLPYGLRENGRWSRLFVDLMVNWQMGNREDRISLDRLARFLGVGQKNGSGADFARIYRTDKAVAMNYLKNDLELTQRVHDKMTIMDAQLPQLKKFGAAKGAAKQPIVDTIP